MGIAMSALIQQVNMSKYEYTEKCSEISGFGGGYEQACRKMVVAGMEWIDEHPGANLKVGSFKGVFGPTSAETEDTKLLEEAILKAVENGCTGAMLHAAYKHIFYAKHHGWEAYIREMEKRDE
jgi:hypothetical protein